MSEPAGESDLKGLSLLLSECCPRHPVSEQRLQDRLFRHPGFDPALARVVRGARRRIVSIVAAVTLPEKDGRRRAQLMILATRRKMRRQGLARELYAEMEANLRRRGFHDILVSGGVFPSGVDLCYEAATVMLMRRLYVATSVAYDMTLDPERRAPSVLPVPKGYVAREMTMADAPALDELCEKEFSGWRGCSALIESGPGSGMIGAFKRATGKLAAFAGFNDYVFGPTGTAKEHRRHGLGSAVFWPAMRKMQAAMPDTPVLIENANIMFYARAFGCHIRGVCWKMCKDLTADPAISKGKEN